MAGIYDPSSMPSRTPSVAALWRMARAEREKYAEQLDYYYELLEKHGHRKGATGKW